MPFGIWLELERWRFARAGHKATVIGRPDKRIALFRWPFRRKGPASDRQSQGNDTADSFHYPVR